jgi:antitoxin HicB
MPEAKTLDYYQKLKYPIEIVEDDDAYVASIPDLPGCAAYGDTVQHALDSLQSFKKMWLEGRLEAGLSIPEPAELEEYSGKFVLRITRGLHKSLQREAQRQGVSLNQYIGQVLAERHKLLDLDYVVREAVTKCFKRPEPVCEPNLAYWNVVETPMRASYKVTTSSVLNENFTNSFEALLGEKQRKTYQFVTHEPYNEIKWTSDAPKKTKAHAHHC